MHALQIDNSTLLNLALGGSTGLAQDQEPAVVSGLMVIGLKGADGTSVDPLPIKPVSSMSALLPLSQGYNASADLFCVEVSLVYA